MDSNDVWKYAIFYPDINHPLSNKEIELKLRYVGILEYYAKQYHLDNPIIDARIEQFKQIFLEGIDITIPICFDAKKDAKNIMKTRFVPFKLFSYRYLFLFDCLLILAPDNRVKGEEICNVLKASLSKRYHRVMDLMLKQMYDNNFDFILRDFITLEMVHYWSEIQNFINTKNKNILFTATMSAGKSTLIDSIIGEELSYTQKAACTATIMKFLSSPISNRCFNVFLNKEYYFNKDSKTIRELTKRIENPCEIIGYFDSPLSRKKFTLIDTPGVNSSRNPSHKKITCKELQETTADVIVYVTPVENYGSEDDYFHLKFIKQKVKYKKILFVINMMDTCDLEDDTVEEIVTNMVSHLILIGFEDPIVCPISAKAGFLLKRVIVGYKLSKNDKRVCRLMLSRFLEEGMNLSKYYPSVSKDEINIRSQINLSDINEDALKSSYINTGLPGFEKLLLKIVEEDN